MAIGLCSCMMPRHFTASCWLAFLKAFPFCYFPSDNGAIVAYVPICALVIRCVTERTTCRILEKKMFFCKSGT